MIVDATTLATLRAAMLPMDGSIADHAEPILAAVADAVPSAARPALGYVDLTAGSCLLPMAFAAAGARRVVVNDVAARSVVAARALFLGAPLDAAMLQQACAGRLPRRPHRPSFHIVADHLMAPTAALFDRLFHAEAPSAEAASLRYLALLFVLGFADPDDGFRILMTHDPAQLRADRETDWSAFLARLDAGAAPLAAARTALVAAQSALRTPGPARRVLHADMQDIAAGLDYTAPCLVAVNPPTNGVDEYLIDDQILHGLIANRQVPLARAHEDAATFWRRRVVAALTPLPRGTLYLVWGGDGAMDAQACCAVWSRFGDAVHQAQVPLGPDRTALWGVFRRR